MKIRVTLKRSFIGRPGKVERILRSLGLRKLNQSVVHDDTPSVRGMIRKISTMVEVVGLKEQEARKLKGTESKN